MPKEIQVPAAEPEREVQVTVTGIPEDLLRKIDLLAKKERRSRSGYIVSRLEQLIARHSQKQAA